MPKPTPDPMIATPDEIVSQWRSEVDANTNPIIYALACIYLELTRVTKLMLAQQQQQQHERGKH